jgi:hypothetical protein
MFRRSAISSRTAALLSLALFMAATAVHGKAPRAPDSRFVEAGESLIRTSLQQSKKA